MDILNPQLAEALQNQITRERLNAVSYTVLEQRFTFAGLTGLAAWASRQAGEEQAHAALIADYLTDKRGVMADMRALPTVAYEYLSPLAAFQWAAGVEAQTTTLIQDLAALADEVEDVDAGEFLLWFIAEQRKSEAEFKTWIARLKFVSGDGAGLLLFDHELEGGK